MREENPKGAPTPLPTDLYKYCCDLCDKGFNRKPNLERHKDRVHRKGNRLEKVLYKDLECQEGLEINKTQGKFNARFGIHEDVYTCNLAGKPENVDAIDHILCILNNLIDHVLNDTSEDTLIQFCMESKREIDYPIVLPFLKRNDLTIDLIMNEIAKVLQSYKEFDLEKGFYLRITTVKDTKIKGYTGKIKLKEWAQTSKSIIKPPMFTRNHCFLEAVILALALLIAPLYSEHNGVTSFMPLWLCQWGFTALWNREIVKKLLTSRALMTSLTKKIKRIMQPRHNHFTGMHLSDIKWLQSEFLSLIGYRLHVFSMRHSNGLIFSQPPLSDDNPGQNIYIFLKNEHAYTISKLCGFLQVRYFCPICMTAVSNKNTHKCHNICYLCGVKEGSKDCTGAKTMCHSCNRYFQGPQCYDNHIKNGVCTQMKLCLICNQYVKKNKEGEMTHRCGYKRCVVCKVLYDSSFEHKCFIEPIWSPDEDKGEFVYLAFDIESLMERNFTQTSMEHKPVCICSTITCHECCDQYPNMDDECHRCGKRHRVFFGLNALEKFCKYAFRNRKIETLLIAHNGGAYDFIFLINYLHENGIIPEIIAKGNRIISFKVPKFKIRGLDLIQFLPMSLSNVHSSMGATIAERKGFCPYMNWTPQNLESVYPHYPPPHYFNVKDMSLEKKAEFEAWYEQVKHRKFNVKKEMINYCKNDVAILMECFLKFKKMFLIATRDICDRMLNGVNPYKSITLASACARVYRGCFLEKNSLAILPPKVHNETQSQSALLWMKYIAYKEQVHVHHSRNGEEIKIGGKYKIDGLYRKNGTVHLLDYRGCFFHSCKLCYVNRGEIHRFKKVTMEEVYEETLRIEKEICSMMPEAEMHIMWECQFNKMQETDNELKEFVKNTKIFKSTNLHNALFGGRTEVMCVKAESTKFETIQHYDVTSLYPSVQFEQAFPLGHPIIITEIFETNLQEYVDKYRGYIRCDVLAPKGLFIPILPCKINSKLHFTLCRKCSELGAKKCLHKDCDRQLTGTWSTPELKMALLHGYIIVYIYEIWHWNSWCDNVFKDYIKTFYKTKICASGFPSSCVTDAEKQEYVENINRQENWALKVHDIKKNKGLRTISKALLNSLWGKLAERLVHDKIKYTGKPSDLQKLLTSSLNKLKQINVVNEDMVRLVYEESIENACPKIFQNIAVAGYVTSYARLHLFEILIKLGKNLCYCDTDSGIFRWPVDKELKDTLQIGTTLGLLTNELKDGDYIEKFLSIGPKSYGYKCKSGAQKIAMKGIMQTSGVSDTITLTNLEHRIDNFIQNKEDAIKIIYPYKISKCLKSGKVLSAPMSKVWRCVMDKRYIDEKTYLTYPYGYQ